jgi:histidinol-phosphate aminotransferase
MSHVKKGLDCVGAYVPGKPIEEVERQLHLQEVYKLASNEIPLAPLYIRSAILKELGNINRYPESGSFYLRQALAKKLKVSDEQLVFGNGSDELIVLALKAFIDPGDEVVVAYPTFLIYEIQAKVCGATVRKVPLKNYRYDLEGIAAQVNARTKIIFIANPDNPTGTYCNGQEIADFLSKIPTETLVFFDEAYFEFTPSDFPQTKEFLATRGNIICSRTFSKAYGLAGLRIGYAITTVDIAKALDKVREPFNINRFAQVAALEALKSKVFLTKVTGLVSEGKKYLYKELKKMNVSFIESATNFILVDMHNDAQEAVNYLLKNGVIVRDLAAWGLRNCFRVTVGLQKENRKFIELFKKFLDSAVS